MCEFFLWEIGGGKCWGCSQVGENCCRLGWLGGGELQPVASLGQVSPETATEGVTPIFSLIT